MILLNRKLKKITAFFISISVLIIAFSFAYYLVVFLPEKEWATLNLQRQEQKIKEQVLQMQKTQEEKIQGVQEEAEQKVEVERTARLDQLNQCLDAAKSENSRITEELLRWAERENKDGKYDLTGAFDSLTKQLEQALEECYRKYPQN